MLESVGHPYAVNPDRALAKIAHEREWPILIFDKPVKPKDRRRPTTPVIVGAAVLGALVVAGRIWQKSGED
jgi:hypothetical protein